MRHVYAERHELVMRALGGELQQWLSPVRAAAGLHVSAVSTGLTAGQLRETAGR